MMDKPSRLNVARNLRAVHAQLTGAELKGVDLCIRDLHQGTIQ
jgi:hypothetical protein